MDLYDLSSAPDCFPIDDFLDFSGGIDQLFSSSTATNSDLQFPHFPTFNINNDNNNNVLTTDQLSSDFICLPNNEVVELEWLSNLVDDSLMNFPADDLTVAGNVNLGPDQMSYHSRSRSKRSRPTSTSNVWTILNEPPVSDDKAKPNIAGRKRDSSGIRDRQDVIGRRCTHCSSEKTPQWRSGPLGPKTLCNACGVRYKSGRLVPEYRPAASPTFVLTQHSNSHRKVMELRRQKEIVRQDHHYHHHQKNFEVC
ncbi:GATA transcription factor 4-like [Impatiens glandulifera]|uniref:GATA transcription factor 4-like n=1 Tax=Impatiens glandulifera TaxID=253017 RepID=UPI001FB11DC7|nr:GATA transcription factor 4-like [Impatiens glandulifera]